MSPATTQLVTQSTQEIGNQSIDLGRRVHLTMQRLGYSDLHGVQCVAYDGHIRLRGTLKSFYLKQVAQSIAMKTPGVRQVTNDISVVE